MPACHAGGRGFESRPDRINKSADNCQHLFFVDYTVYILYSGELDLFYKGQTKDLTKRIARHNSGLELSTKNGVPWRLIWNCSKTGRKEALELEKKLKNLNRKRLIQFILKFGEEVAGPDELLLVKQLSG
jgi:putative endonuclease